MGAISTLFSSSKGDMILVTRCDVGDGVGVVSSMNGETVLVSTVEIFTMDVCTNSLSPAPVILRESDEDSSESEDEGERES